MILCILNGEMLFKMNKKKIQKKMCAYPTLNFQTLYPKQTSFIIWPNINGWTDILNIVHMHSNYLGVVK